MHSPISAPCVSGKNPVTLPAAVAQADQYDRTVTRELILEKKKQLRMAREDAAREARNRALPAECKSTYYDEIRETVLKEQELESMLQDRFLPQHSPRQLITPQAFFVSPLFRVASRAATRESDIDLELTNDHQGKPVYYSGPELRQAEGLVFMALLNMSRDIRTGTLIQFSPEAVCKALFGRYDGPTRARLKDYIRRLQKGQVRFAAFTVHLCLRFSHPASGMWSVALDEDIVGLFKNSTVWLDLNRRLELPEGLSTWLYAYVESQTRLIPTSVETLRKLSGSAAEDKPFRNKLRIALQHLKAHGVLREGWSISEGVVRWCKT